MRPRPGLLAACLVVALIVWPFAADWFSPERASGPDTYVSWFGGPPPAFALRRTICGACPAAGFPRVLALERNNREIFATGAFVCEAGAIWLLDIEITQGDAVAEGHDEGNCSGEQGTWDARAVANGPASFAPGRASGCGRFIQQLGSDVTDFEWCADFTLARGRGLAGDAR